MASTLLAKPFPSRPLPTSCIHFSGRSFAVRRRRSVHLSRFSCTGSPRLSKSFGELSVSANGVGEGGDRAMSASVEASSKVGSGFHLFRRVLNAQQPNSRALRGRSPVCVSSSHGGLGHESDMVMPANSSMDGYAPPHALPDRYGGPVEGHHYGGEDRETGSGIQGGNSRPGSNPSDGYRPADEYASHSSHVEEFNPVQSPRSALNSTSHSSPTFNRPLPEAPRTAGAYRAPSPTGRPMEGSFNRSQAPPSRAYSTSSGPVEGSYRPPQEPSPIESSGSPSNPSYSQQQPGNIYRPPQGGGASPSPVSPQQQQQQQQQQQHPDYRTGQDSRFNDSYRPRTDSPNRNVASGVPPSRQSGSLQGGSYTNTQDNVKPVNFNTAQEGSNAGVPYDAGSNNAPGNTSKTPDDREPSAAAAAIDKYLGPSTLKLEKRDSNSPPPPPPPRKRYPNTTEKKSGKDLVAESAACAVIEKYLGPWPGFPPRDPKIDEYLDSLPENAACAAIDKYFGPYKPLFVFKKNEGENADNGPVASRPPRNRNMGRSGPRSRAWNPPQGASTSRPWTPPSQGSSESQNRNLPPQGANESKTWTPPQGTSDRKPTGPDSEDVKPQ